MTTKMPPLESFQEYLSAAVQLKSALVKSKPGRQEWEQAPPFMRCTAAAVDSVRRARTSSFSEQYSTALQLKDQGNELINKDPAAALERYSQALSVFLWFDRGPDRSSEDVPLVCPADKLQGAEQHQAHHLLAVSFSNAAACLLQLGMAADAEYACSTALKYDPYSVKAYYRRAMAHRAVGTTAGLEAAVSDLASANQLEPANNQVRLALAALQHELREHRRQERGMYGNLFQRGELYGDNEVAGGGLLSRRAATHAAASAGAAAETRAAGAATANDNGDDDDENECDWGAAEDSPGGDGGGLDPEDLLFLDPKARKAESALASREADLVMRKMQVALARSRTRHMAARLEAERARRLGGGAGAAGGAGRFPWWAVPWWAYALIGLHLAYRLIRVWRLPPSSASGGGLSPGGGGGMQEAEAAAAVMAAAAGVQQPGGGGGGHLEL
ncbi:hypothetical protein PLESTB_001549200 [Pleodorina starrii]|uniref:Uncharacterized protein n=1 Tax=Pleodorina starrii TaxID=330485 RepID=A0A9W6BX81_9CHLO|nr:hypothetical protein PLESTB_001549200 [Pleodorina starrii]GLC69072.1 hypothetical protein PLESTF_000783900 [Pleodorina starrii]